MYPIRLIPLVVQNVPSAHVLLAELHELVLQAHLQRRIFAIHLIAELAEKVKVMFSADTAVTGPYRARPSLR